MLRRKFEKYRIVQVRLFQSDFDRFNDNLLSSDTENDQFAMKYEEKYNELVELSHSENSEIKEKADAWLIGIGLQGAAKLKVSAFLLDLAIRNVKGEITRDEVSQRLKEHYGNTEYVEPKSELNGGYEIIPPDSPRIKEIEEYNRKLRPALYAELDKKKRT